MGEQEAQNTPKIKFLPQNRFFFTFGQFACFQYKVKGTLGRFLSSHRCPGPNATTDDDIIKLLIGDRRRRKFLKIK